MPLCGLGHFHIGNACKQNIFLIDGLLKNVLTLACKQDIS